MPDDAIECTRTVANLERERGGMEEAMRLYRETSTLADQLGAEDIAVGAHAGAGLSALRLDLIPAAQAALDAAYQIFAGRTDWWFQGRELLESLTIRIYAHGDRHDAAMERFRTAVARLEPMDAFAAAWLVADCAATLAERNPEVWDEVRRFAAHVTVQDFVTLSARFTALKDMADRLPGVRFVAPPK